jgi:hypothetical protein
MPQAWENDYSLIFARSICKQFIGMQLIVFLQTTWGASAARMHFYGEMPVSPALEFTIPNSK